MRYSGQSVTTAFISTRQGHSGVALYSRKPPDQIVNGLGWEDMDAEGRYLEARFGDLNIAPRAVGLLQRGTSSGQIRLYGPLAGFLRERVDAGRHFIFCGDWNIAHKAIDLKNWRGNQKNSGFLPEERAWLDARIEEGWVDAFRVVNSLPKQYRWWSNRGQA